MSEAQNVRQNHLLVSIFVSGAIGTGFVRRAEFLDNPVVKMAMCFSNNNHVLILLHNLNKCLLNSLQHDLCV